MVATYLTGTKKNDTFIINEEDVVQINAKSGGNDTIYFNQDIDFDDIDVEKDGQNLVFKANSDKTVVTISNYFSADGKTTSSTVKNIKVGTTQETTKIASILDTYPINSGFSSFTPDSKGRIYGTIFSDEITDTENKDIIYSNGGFDEIITTKGGDTINLKKDNNEDAVVVKGEEFGNVKIYNALNNDSIYINDILPSNSHYLKMGNNLVISNFMASSSVAPQYDKNNTVTIVDYFKNMSKGIMPYIYGAEDILVTFSDDDRFFDIDISNAKKGQTVKGTQLNEIVYSSAKADKIYTGGGMISWIYAAGNDTIYAQDNLTGISDGFEGKLTVYANTNKDSVTQIDTTQEFSFARSNFDLILRGLEYGNQIVLKNYLKTAQTVELQIDDTTYENIENLIDYAQCKGVTELDYSGEKKGRTIQGTRFSDYVKGTQGNDKYYSNGTTDCDVFYGNKGNDKIYVNTPEYIELGYHLGDGNDTIYATEGSDLVLYMNSAGGVNDDVDFITYEKSSKGNDLYINYYDKDLQGKNINSNRITIKDYFKKQDVDVYFQGIKNASDINLAGIYVNGAKNKANKLYGTTNKNFLVGGNKNDKFYCGDGFDTVISGNGNDTIYAENLKTLTIEPGFAQGVDTVYTSKDVNVNIKDTYGEYSFYKTNNNDVVIGSVYGWDENNDWESIVQGSMDKSKTILKNFDGNIYHGDELVNQAEMGRYIQMPSGKAYSSLFPAIANGSDYDDYIIAGKNYSVINAGSGEIDFIETSTTSTAKTKIDGGNGDDTVIIKNAKTGNVLTNVEEINFLNTKESQLKFFFEVTKEGGYTSYDFSKMFAIYDSKNVSQALNGGKFDANGFINSGTYVTGKDWIDVYVCDKNGYQTGEANLFSIANGVGNNVRNYLIENNISSYLDLLNTDTTGFTKEELAQHNQHKKNIYNIFNKGLSGDDTIVADYYNVDVYDHILAGEKGNDTYIIGKRDYNGGTKDYATTSNVIRDTAGKNDTLIMETVTQDDITLIFDVNLKTKKGKVLTDNLGNAKYSTTGSLILSADNDYESNPFEHTRGATIENYFSSGKIENIYLKDNAALDMSGIDETAQKVANWLKENNFTSVSEVFEKDSFAQKGILYSLFQGKYDNRLNQVGTDDEDIIIQNSQIDIISSGAGGDNIFAVNNNGALEKIDAGAGGDWICSDVSNIVIDCGAGNDDVEIFEAENVTVNGGTDQAYVQTVNSKNITINMSENTSVEYRLKNSTGAINGASGEDKLYLNDSEFNVKTETGDDKIYCYGYGKNTIEAGAGNDTINLESGYNYVKAGDGDDVITIYNLQNIDSWQQVEAGNGNDTITSFAGGKIVAGDGADTVICINKAVNVTTNRNGLSTNTTAPDIVDLSGVLEDGSYVYANSHNSEMIITGSNYNDYYKAFKENNTQITDNGGNDTLEILNSYNTTSIIFNVDSDYSIEKDGVNFGDITFTYKDDVDNWLNGSTNKHLTVKDNAIENIIIGDEESDTWGTRGRMTTNVQIAELAETVAGWLATNEYADVNAVISGGNADDIAALTAIFTEGNYWGARA